MAFLLASDKKNKNKSDNWGKHEVVMLEDLKGAGRGSLGQGEEGEPMGEGPAPYHPGLASSLPSTPPGVLRQLPGTSLLHQESRHKFVY